MRKLILSFFLVSLFGCSPPEEKAQSLANQASAALKDGKAEKAQQLFSQAVDLRPEAVEYRVGLAQALRRLGREEETRKQYEKAMDLIEKQSLTDPDRVDDHAMILVALGREQEARELIAERARRFPKSATVRKLADHEESVIQSFRQMNAK